MNSEIFFESAGDERVTPQDFFDKCHAEFDFEIDVAASPLNNKLPLYFGEGGVAYDALAEDWGGMRCWLNPPYSICGAFVGKAVAEAQKGALVVVLLPVRSDTKFWHQYIWNKDLFVDGDWRDGVRGRFLPGRLRFELKVTDKMRGLIIAEMKALGPVDNESMNVVIKQLVEATGLPKMAIKGICAGLPDEDLLTTAPFPSCLIIFGDQS